MLKKKVIIGLVLFSSLVFAVIILIVTGNCCFPDSCEIPIGKSRSFPVIVNLKEKRFIYPTDNEALVIPRGESVILACPGSELNVGVAYTKITCITETFFLLFEDNIDVTSLYCEDSIKSIARYTGNSCEYNGKEIEVGFDFGQDTFIRTMRICFDDKKQNTIYTEHNLTNHVSYREQSRARPYFEEANFYNLTGNKLYQLYSRRVQRATINKQLGIKDPNSTEVIKDGGYFYLARGHLAPKADFVYAVEQNASFYYVNTAPQWGSINSGGWSILESKIRKYVEKRNSFLQIITGTYGDFILSNHKGVPLFLYSNRSSTAIPIPAILWKVVFDPVSRLGVVFVANNDPYLDKIEYLCKDVSKLLSWITLTNKNITTGIIYACDINELSTTVTYIPRLNTKGLLIE